MAAALILEEMTKLNADTSGREARPRNRRPSKNGHRPFVDSLFEPEQAATRSA